MHPLCPQLVEHAAIRRPQGDVRKWDTIRKRRERFVQNRAASDVNCTIATVPRSACLQRASKATCGDVMTKSFFSGRNLGRNLFRLHKVVIRDGAEEFGKLDYRCHSLLL
jgi:hypothetical protein